MDWKEFLSKYSDLSDGEIIDLLVDKYEVPRIKSEITRLEVINHASTEVGQIGRMLTLYKNIGGVNSFTLSYQDGGRTLKIFID